VCGEAHEPAPHPDQIGQRWNALWLKALFTSQLVHRSPLPFHLFAGALRIDFASLEQRPGEIKMHYLQPFRELAISLRASSLPPYDFARNPVLDEAVRLTVAAAEVECSVTNGDSVA
jgi:hypothetical protein